MNAHGVLLVSDEPNELSHVKELLESKGYKVETAGNEEEVLGRLGQEVTPKLIILDMVMTVTTGLQLLEHCKRIRPEQKLLMISCSGESTHVVHAIKLGAEDFITRPFRPSRLQEAVFRVIGPGNETPAPVMKIADNEAELVESLDEELFFLAASPAMKQIRAQVALIAKVDMPVLLLGESGVGKEVIARLIHKMSPRAGAPLLKVNCAALPKELLESELFGYEAGAFSGAIRSKPGKFELCNKGTMLLDEIGEMSPWLQAKMLHVLQDGRFSRLGGKLNIAVDVRVLAATNIDVEMAIARKEFREDLLYRLNAFTVKIPPLRERREEIPALLRHFMISQAAKLRKPALSFSDRLVQECMRYHWPGNLRELVNVVKRYLVLESEDLIIEELRVKDQDFDLEDSPDAAAPSSDLKARVTMMRDETESKEIQRALENANWNRRVAAAKLRISYRTLLTKIKRHRLYPPAEPKDGWLNYG